MLVNSQFIIVIIIKIGFHAYYSNNETTDLSQY